MPKAFICGCAGLVLDAEERAFLRREDPWGLILFKRNVADRDQVRALTRSFRECVGRAECACFDRSGGRPGSAHGAATLARIPRSGCDRGRVGALPSRGGSASCRPPYRFRSGRSWDHRRLCACARCRRARNARRHRQPGLLFSARARRRDGSSGRRGASCRRRRARCQAYAGAWPGARRQPSRAARCRRRVGCPQTRFCALCGAQRPADGDERACPLYGD